MERGLKLDPQLLEEFEQAAREQRRNPARLLQQVVREYLEIYEDEKLFGQMQSEARRSGYREADAVHLVSQARREMKKQNGAS